MNINHIRLTTSLVCLCLLPVAITNQSSAVERPDFITDSQARRAGLEIIWSSHVALDSSRGTVVSIDQQIGPKKQWISYEVKFENNTDSFSERDRDKVGKRLGRYGAKLKAEKYLKTMLDLGIEATLETTSHDIPPEIFVYALTTSGKIHCLNGETGETIWTAHHGIRNVPVWMSADRGFVAFVTGNQVYCLDGYTGELMWQRRAVGVPASKPAITNEYIFVPMVNGLIQDFNIRRTNVYPESIRSPGHIYVAALATPDRIVWVTDKAHLNVAYGNQTSGGRGIDFRLQLQSPVVSPPTALEVRKEGEPIQDLILTGNTEGYVHCVDAHSGSIRWVFPTGGSVRTSPVGYGNDVYVATTQRQLFSIGSRSGLEVWRTSDIHEAFGASETKLFCIDGSGDLAVLDRQTGNRLATLPVAPDGFHMKNLKTDRIFLGSKHGNLQCLHVIGQDEPLFHRQINKEETQKEREQRKRSKSTGSKPAMIDPFGAGVEDDDPFAAPAMTDDPFATPAASDDDPFATPAMSSDDDPFGAGPAKSSDDDDDPFK